MHGTFIYILHSSEILKQLRALHDLNYKEHVRLL